MIETLIDKGFAYPVSDGTVYFAVRKFGEYGKLSHKDIDDLEGGHRNINVAGDEKRDPLDFVLWKPKKDGEPYWESPWCQGRPGWHIECSVMSKRYLGDTIDIHAGGEDLIFPHHENEIAQSEAANGAEFAHYWMHNGFLNIDNKKMSKSLGNFFTVRDIQEKYDLQVLRFFMLSAHYRSPLNFSAELMASAKSGLERIRTAGDRLLELKEQASGQLTEEEQNLLQGAAEYIKKFEAAMEDDFNTADAVSAIFELVKYANTHVTDQSSKELVEKIYQMMQNLMNILGVDLTTEEDDLDAHVQEMIAKRQQARKDKDFALADQIRDQLLAEGIQLLDTREGVKWKKV
jgi:cysteinyl-tRNA synthetase